jgi:hypothetical protein
MENIFLCISGYRNFNDYKVFKDALDKFIIEIGMPEVMYFGECAGVDKMALKYAKENELPYRIYYADWKTHGLKAGPLRNKDMIDISTHLLAFLSKDSKGTKNAISLAKKQNLHITIIDI